MPDEFDVDVAVVGSGAAGQTVAYACREAGMRVVVVDKRPLGGTCALRGCDPKKVLVGVAAAARRAHALSGFGLSGAPRVAWHDLMRFKRSFTDPVPEQRQEALAAAGIDVRRGVARFLSEGVLDVEGERLEAAHVVVAAGAKPAPLGFPGEEHVATSTDFLDLEELPARIVFIGGGYVSLEFAHVAAASGAHVTVLHRGARVLAHFDPALTRPLEEATRRAGIDLRLDARVVAVARAQGGFRVDAETERGRTSLAADLVVHGAGRVAEVDDLDLAAGRVARGRRGGVLVEPHLQSTTNPRVWACGDAAESPGMPLTPVASLEGSTVAHNLVHGERQTPDYAGTPSVAFTLPPIAMVGLTEEQATRSGRRFRVASGETASWQSSRRVREEAGAYKVLVEEGTDLVLGAHLLGPRADETINLFALAIRHGIAASALRESVYAYPTSGSDVPYMV